MKKYVNMILATFLILFLGQAMPVSAATTKTVTVTNAAGQVLKTFQVDTSAVRNGGLQDALDYVGENASSGNIMTITIPGGTYHVEQTLNMYSNTTLKLSGGAKLIRDCDSALIRFGRASGDSIAGDGETSGYKGYKNISIIGESGKLGVLDGGKENVSILRFAHADNVKIQYIQMTKVKSAHHMEFAGSRNVVVDHCLFDGFSYASGDSKLTNYEAIQLDILNEAHFNNYGKYDGTVNQKITISNNTFDKVQRGVGAHSAEVGRYFDTVIIKNNTFKNVEGFAVVTTNFINSTITGNTITDCGSGIIFRNMIPEYVNYYPGDKKTIKTGSCNSTISGNKISIKDTGYDITKYGIKAYGEQLSADKKVTYTAADKTKKSFYIPKGDYRVNGLVMKNNNITMKCAGNGVWLDGVCKSKVESNIVKAQTNINSNTSCDGVKLEISSGNTVFGNEIANTGGASFRNGIYIKDVSDGNTVSKNKIATVPENGIHVYKSKGCTFSSNNINQTGKHGIYLNAKSGTKDKKSVASKNTITNASGRGICVNDKTYADIVQNTIKTTKNEGIYAGKKSNVSVKKNDVSSTKSHGIYINTESSAKSIEKNKVNKTGKHGIYISEKSVGTTISENDISNTGKNGIAHYSNKSATTIKNNKIKKCKSYGIDLCKKINAKVTENTITKCPMQIRIQSKASCKISTENLKITKLTTKKNKVTVKWNKMKAITSYKVYRSTSKDGKYKLLATTNKTSYVDKTVKSGKKYYYKVLPYTKYDKVKVTGVATPIKMIKCK